MSPLIMCDLPEGVLRFLNRDGWYALEILHA